jgi:hypothetical protein
MLPAAPLRSRRGTDAGMSGWESRRYLGGPDEPIWRLNLHTDAAPQVRQQNSSYRQRWGRLQQAANQTKAAEEPTEAYWQCRAAGLRPHRTQPDQLEAEENKLQQADLLQPVERQR